MQLGGRDILIRDRHGLETRSAMVTISLNCICSHAFLINIAGNTYIAPPHTSTSGAFNPTICLPSNHQLRAPKHVHQFWLASPRSLVKYLLSVLT